MLVDLRIRNFAIIDEASITFGPGLNVLTGETGAGKSIILGALDIILGGKLRSHMIRDGEDFLEVEARFDLSELPQAFIQTLPEIAQGEELVIVRNVTSLGKSKVYINGRLGTVALLSEIGSSMISICGQAQHIKLMDSTFHLAVLDIYGGHQDKIAEYSHLYADLRLAERKYNDARSSDEERSRRLLEIEDTVKELESAELSSGIRNYLESEIKRLSSGEKLTAGFEKIIENLSGERGSLSLIKDLCLELKDLSHVDSSIELLQKSANSIRTELEEILRESERYGSRITLDERKLESLRERLAEVARLERKYKRNDSELVEFLSGLKLERDSLGNIAAIGELRKETEKLRIQATKLAEEISQHRKKASQNLTQSVQKELADLNMKDAKLEVQYETGALCPQGIDVVEFMFSANKGEKLKPLKMVASGGELSRLTLVLKKVLNDKTGTNVLVFDEVDTGISGSVARAVGLKLKALSENSQVLCITHLPQVASLADTHLVVQKSVIEGRTVSHVSTLNSKERVDEVARMLAGTKVTEAAKKSARELIMNRVD